MVTAEQKIGESRWAGVGGEGAKLERAGRWQGGGVISQSLVGCCKDFGICSESSGSHGAF